MLAIVQTSAHMMGITGNGATRRQWLRDATALPPFLGRGSGMPQSNHVSNQLLASLGEAELRALAPQLKIMDLPHEKVIYETGEAVDIVYFPLAGIISLVVDLASGEMIEAAMVGRDGVVGAAAALSGTTALTRAVVQVAGVASVMAADRFRLLAQGNAAFNATLIRHELFLLAQAQQSAACNAAHALEARMARWLLRCRDLAGDDIADPGVPGADAGRAAHERLRCRQYAAKGWPHPLSARSYPRARCGSPARVLLRMLRDREGPLGGILRQRQLIFV
jgi:CRP-like cAMP-binding protein